jgi:hypothetical protein
MRPQERLDLRPEGGVACARLIEKRRPLLFRPLYSRRKNLLARSQGTEGI